MKEGLLLHSIFAPSVRTRRDQNITILALLSPDRPLTKRMGSQTMLLADTSQKRSCVKVYSSEFFSRTEWRRLLSCRIEDIAGERGRLTNTRINKIGIFYDIWCTFTYALLFPVISFIWLFLETTN